MEIADKEEVSIMEVVAVVTITTTTTTTTMEEEDSKSSVAKKTKSSPVAIDADLKLEAKGPKKAKTEIALLNLELIDKSLKMEMYYFLQALE